MGKQRPLNITLNIFVPAPLFIRFVNVKNWQQNEKVQFYWLCYVLYCSAHVENQKATDEAVNKER